MVIKKASICIYLSKIIIDLKHIFAPAQSGLNVWRSIEGLRNSKKQILSC